MRTHPLVKGGDQLARRRAIGHVPMADMVDQRPGQRVFVPVEQHRRQVIAIGALALRHQFPQCRQECRHHRLGRTVGQTIRNRLRLGGEGQPVAMLLHQADEVDFVDDVPATRERHDAALKRVAVHRAGSPSPPS
ncbi:hypothetical protein P0F65_12205 [Sphingomonas sp. I4]